MTKYLEYGKCLETGETGKSFEYRNNDFCDRHTDTQTHTSPLYIYHHRKNHHHIHHHHCKNHHHNDHNFTFSPQWRWLPLSSEGLLSTLETQPDDEIFNDGDNVGNNDQDMYQMVKIVLTPLTILTIFSLMTILTILKLSKN